MVAPRWRLGHEPTTARGRLEVQTAMSDNVIEVQNLTKRYGQTTVVKGISFSVGRGEIFGLLGPNGSGKTTTILMLMGLTEISDGKVRLFGLDPAREPLAVKRRIGYLPDAVGFYDNLSAAAGMHILELTGPARAIAGVCTENSILVDSVVELPIV